MNTIDIESKRSKVARWKLNVLIFLTVLNVVGITIIIGSLNQINRNITSINAACLLSEAPSALNFLSKRK